jgi:hypothetical protein
MYREYFGVSYCPVAESSDQEEGANQYSSYNPYHQAQLLPLGRPTVLLDLTAIGINRVADIRLPIAFVIALVIALAGIFLMMREGKKKRRK